MYLAFIRSSRVAGRLRLSWLPRQTGEEPRKDPGGLGWKRGDGKGRVGQKWGERNGVPPPRVGPTGRQHQMGGRRHGEGGRDRGAMGARGRGGPEGGSGERW